MAAKLTFFKSINVPDIEPGESFIIEEAVALPEKLRSLSLRTLAYCLTEGWATIEKVEGHALNLTDKEREVMQRLSKK